MPNHEVAAQHPGILTPDVTLVILTWVSFISLLIILHRFAWKPILAGLQAREQSIRKSMDDVDNAKSQLLQVEETKTKILNDAKVSANTIIEDARKIGGDIGRQLEQKAKQEAERIIASAHQEIEGERERVRMALKKESAQTAVSLAEKILKENLDNDKNRRLIDDAMKNI